MRIGFISTYPPLECGIATYTEALREPLDQQHETFVLSQIGAAGRDVHGVYDPKTPFAGHLFDTSTKLTPDLIHVQHEYGLFGEMHGVQFVDLLMRYRLAEIPVVTTLHTVYESLSRPQELILDQIMQHSARVIVHEPYQKQTLENYFGRRMNVAEKVAVIEHGIRECGPVPNAKRQLGLNGRKVVMLCGYFRPTKGFHKIVKLLPQLIERDEEITLVLAGKLRGIEAQNYRDDLLKMIAEAGVDSKHVKVFRGQFPQHTFDTVLSAADVMCLPYDVGAQSGMMCQCFAMGAPIVSSNLRAFRNAIERTGGGLVCESDEEYVDKILTLLNDQRLREEMKRSVRDYIEQKAGWSRVAEAHEAVYCEAMSEDDQPGEYLFVDDQCETILDKPDTRAARLDRFGSDEEYVDDFAELNFEITRPKEPAKRVLPSTGKALTRPGRESSYAVRGGGGSSPIGKMSPKQ